MSLSAPGFRTAFRSSQDLGSRCPIALISFRLPDMSAELGINLYRAGGSVVWRIHGWLTGWLESPSDHKTRPGSRSMSGWLSTPMTTERGIWDDHKYFWRPLGRKGLENRNPAGCGNFRKLWIRKLWGPDESRRKAGRNSREILRSQALDDRRAIRKSPSSRASKHNSAGRNLRRSRCAPISLERLRNWRLWFRALFTVLCFEWRVHKKKERLVNTRSTIHLR